ncbi:MAG: DUF4397 domain-containing protein [Roseburia sp.]|nr:DUF4397 domain-containing protein [Roseburia sp.]
MEPVNTPVIPLPESGEREPVRGETMLPDTDYNGGMPDNRMNNNVGTPDNRINNNNGMHENRMNNPAGMKENSGMSIPIGRNGGGAGNDGIRDADIMDVIVSTHPRPNESCRLYDRNDTQFGSIRVLNAVCGYNPFVVFIGECLFSAGLGFGELSAYERIAARAHVITLMGDNGYIYLQKPFQLRNGENATLAVINTESGLDIELIADSSCGRSPDTACIRAANLSYNNGMLSVVIGNHYVNFNGLQYRSVSNFKPIWGGYYTYSVMQSLTARYPGFGNTVLLASYLNLRNDRRYTIYLLNWRRDDSDAIRVIIVEEP